MPLKSGFTLVELAIVIVIIGLLVAGVLQGQTLIEQSALQSTVKDLQSFKAANELFKSKYNCMAGDCPNAQAIFTAAACPDVSGFLCNGNGNKIINGDNREGARYWQHLSLGNMLKGAYQGYYNGDGTNYLGIVVPASKVKGMGYGAFGQNFYQFWTGLPSINVNYIRLGGIVVDTTPANTRVSIMLLNGYQTNNIDNKIDDGLPGSGKFMVEAHISFVGTGSPNCITTNNTATSVYVLQENLPTCSPSYLFDD